MGRRTNWDTGYAEGMGIDKLFAALGLADRPAGILWDMDGTIIDSEPEWLSASIDVVNDAGGVWLEEDEDNILGVSSADHAKALADAVKRGTGQDSDAWELFDKVVDALERHMREGFTLIPGALDLLGAFQEADIPQALVTASPRILVDALFDGIESHPLQAAVTGSDEIPGKPDPAPYLLGAERLGVPITSCLAFEDSQTGLAAARGAGAHTIAVTEKPLAQLVEHLR